jgi:hypothetical protein
MARGWKRLIGFYLAFGGLLALFQQVVQRHVIQHRPLTDLVALTWLGGFAALIAIGLYWNVTNPRER